jgi:hypothetical protein
MYRTSHTPVLQQPRPLKLVQQTTAQHSLTYVRKPACHDDYTLVAYSWPCNLCLLGSMQTPAS